MIKKEDFSIADHKTLIEEINDYKKKKRQDLYLEESKFALFNVIYKQANDNSITGERTSIGYILGNNRIYDFVSKKIFEIYNLYQKDNIHKEGYYALMLNIAFENSERKIKVNENNLLEIERLFAKYTEDYEVGKAQLKYYSKDIDNEECISKRKVNNKY